MSEAPDPAPSLVLRGRRVTLGVTGSIAAYKAAMLARLLVQQGARITTLLTRSASEFVGAATFGGITGEPVLTDLFDAGAGGERHVEIAEATDVLVIAPATADFLARLAAGRADDLLSATVLSSRCPVLVAPAMHPTMWEHPATQRNVRQLEADGRISLVGPVSGEVASGATGMGRMTEPADIVERVAAALDPRDLGGVHVVVTAGPTVEDIDAVRFVSNRSSGKMGFAIAEAVARRGARVTLVAGPVPLPTPGGVRRVDVRSALDMQRALDEALGDDLQAADALIMNAAVGDYRLASVHENKLKRGAGPLTLELVENPDLIAAIGNRRTTARPLLMAFAVETGTDEAIVEHARKKLAQKRVDVVVANHAAESMGRDDNRITFVERDGVRPEPAMSKAAAAERVVDWLAARLGD